jgi:hypothetical protein
MAFVPISSTVQLEYLQRQDGQAVENVVNYRLLGGVPTVGDINVLCAAAVAWWNTNLKPLTASNVSLVGVKATSLQSAISPVVEYLTGLPISGTALGTALPNNVTVVTRLATDARGRSYRGRVYHVGLTTSHVTGNTVNAAIRASLVAAWTAAFTLGASPSWFLVVASRVTNGAPRVNGIKTDVTGVSVNPTIDSQRRRLPERGA